MLQISSNNSYEAPHRAKLQVAKLDESRDIMLRSTNSKRYDEYSFKYRYTSGTV